MSRNLTPAEARRMQLIQQPKRSKLCGHAVIAMVAGVNLAAAISAIGHRKGTKAPELRTALARYGVTVGETKLTAHEEIPLRAIARVTRPRRRNWHWVLVWDGDVLDPSPTPINGGIITSFMEVQCPAS